MLVFSRAFMSHVLKRMPSLPEKQNGLSNLRSAAKPCQAHPTTAGVQSAAASRFRGVKPSPQKLLVCHSWVCLQVKFNMSSFSGVMKGGWHPKGKDGGKESWRGDFKGINQVVSYAAEAVCHQIP